MRAKLNKLESGFGRSLEALRRYNPVLAEHLQKQTEEDMFKAMEEARRK